MFGTLSKHSLRLAVILGLALSMLIMTGVTVAAKKPWETIKWNEPVSWTDRLMADKYILPEGWAEAVKGVKQITFFNSGGLSGDIATAMNMKRFEELTGIKVVAIPVNADVAYAKGLSTLVAKDKSVDAILSNDPALDLASFAAGGWVEPVDHMFPEDVLKLYSPGLKDYYKFGDHWWALGITYIGHIDFYRTSWLEKAGLPVPVTFPEYFDTAKKVSAWAKQSLGPDHYGMVFVGGSQDLINLYRTMVYAQGGRLLYNGKYQFDTPESKNAFALMVEAVKEGYAPVDQLNFAWGDAGTFFGVGKAGFLSAMQPSYVTVFKSQYPQIADDFGTFAPPKWSADQPDEFRGRGVIGANSMLINKAINDNQKAAVMLFYDFVRSKEGQRNELIVEGNESALLPLWENVDEEIAKVDWDFADKVADELNIPHVKRITTLPARDARETNCKNVIFEVYPPGFQEVVRKLIEVYGKASLGEISVEQALKEVQRVADEITP